MTLDVGHFLRLLFRPPKDPCKPDGIRPTTYCKEPAPAQSRKQFPNPPFNHSTRRALIVCTYSTVRICRTPVLTVHQRARCGTRLAACSHMHTTIVAVRSVWSSIARNGTIQPVLPVRTRGEQARNNGRIQASQEDSANVHVTTKVCIIICTTRG
jgi:hypothetical protein